MEKQVDGIYLGLNAPSNLVFWYEDFVIGQPPQERGRAWGVLLREHVTRKKILQDLAQEELPAVEEELATLLDQGLAELADPDWGREERWVATHFAKTAFYAGTPEPPLKGLQEISKEVI